MRNFFPLLLMFLLQYEGKAQFFELSFGAGISAYMGDLAPELKVHSTGILYPAFSTGLRTGIREGLSFKFSATLLTIGAKDQLANDPFRVQRNLSFKSTIKEMALHVEFFPFSSLESPFFSIAQVYLYSGLAYFFHNPKALYQGKWYSLQPLSTEGQETVIRPTIKRYSLRDLSIPFGGGFIFFLEDNCSIGVFLSVRKSFTDYLDDVSGRYVDAAILTVESGEIAGILSNRTRELGSSATMIFPPGAIRGNPDKKDWYATLELSVGFTIYNKGRKAKWWGSSRKKRSLF